MNKICGTCKVSKTVEEFYKNKTKPDGLSSYCKECKKTYNKTHYISNGYIWKDTRAKQRNENKVKCQNFICDYLLEHPCVDCGEDNILVLEFDHLRDKSFNISSRMDSVNTIKLEIEKCEVRCANCHRKKTAERIGGNYRSKFMKLNERP